MTGKPQTADELAADIERRITTGRLAPGQRLDPVRTAAGELGLAPNTVAAAYRRLRDRGLVYGEGRRGTVVAARPLAEHFTPQPAIDGLIDLAGGNPDPALLPNLRRALHRIDTGHVAYGQWPIDPGLARALAADIEPDLGPPLAGPPAAGLTLAVVGGALDGIERTLTAHLRPGDRVAVEDPGYTSVLDLLAAMNLRAVPVPIDRFGPIPARLDRALGNGAVAVIVTPRAQNPTGAALDQDRADELRAMMARRPETLMIEDDHAGPIAGVPYRSLIPANAGRWALIRSVAKSLGPDLRLAALVGDETTVNRVIDRQLLGTGWVSHILQRTVATILDEPSTGRTLERAARTYERRRTAFIDRLEAAGVSADGRSGLNVWVPVEDEALVVAGMQRRGFAVRSGARYRLQSPPAVRVSTGACELGQLEDAADALIAVLGTGVSTRSV